MDILKEHVYTQYNDLTGNVAIDFNSGMEDLFSFARSYGIDTNQHAPIGIRVHHPRDWIKK